MLYISGTRNILGRSGSLSQLVLLQSGLAQYHIPGWLPATVPDDGRGASPLVRQFADRVIEDVLHQAVREPTQLSIQAKTQCLELYLTTAKDRFTGVMTKLSIADSDHAIIRAQYRYRHLFRKVNSYLPNSHKTDIHRIQNSAFHMDWNFSPESTVEQALKVIGDNVRTLYDRFVSSLRAGSAIRTPSLMG